jgi:hypothetical protein
MKVLLIEDRVRRKEQFSEISGIDLSQYSFLKELSAEEYSIIKAELKTGNTSLLYPYDLIMTHKSAFTINEQDLLNSLRIPLVYFTGGVSQAFYTTSPTPSLHMNSKEFYSTNLIQFLNYIESYQVVELLILQFGNNWKLNLLLNIRDEFHQLVYQNENIDLFPEDFEPILNEKIISIIDDADLSELMDYVKKMGVRKNEVERINKIKLGLNQQIQKAVRGKL